MLRKVLAFLLSPNPAAPSIAFDRFIFLFLKSGFIAKLTAYRIILGKSKWDRARAERKLNHNYNWSPSFNLISSVYKLIRRQHSSLIKINAKRFGGYKFYVRADKHDFFPSEDDVIKCLDLREGQTFIDVGAHIGRYTIIGAKLVGRTGKVIAIEANPETFALLNKNVALNDLPNVTTRNYAVYSRESKLRLYLPGKQSGMTVYNTIMTERAQGVQEYIEVRANTLDSILREIKHEDLNQIDWIKIDVEGAEVEVLKGAEELISRNDNLKMLIEVHGEQNFHPVFNLLANHNFKLVHEIKYASGDRHIMVHKGIPNVNKEGNALQFADSAT